MNDNNNINNQTQISQQIPQQAVGIQQPEQVVNSGQQFQQDMNSPQGVMPSAPFYQNPSVKQTEQISQPVTLNQANVNPGINTNTTVNNNPQLSGDKSADKKQEDLHSDAKSNEVTKRDVENVVSSWTGIPISKLTEDESAKLLELEKRIHKRLIDQVEAVVKVSEAVRRGRIGLASGQRPIASFIFLGPSGTGKTELAKTLAEILFGRDDAMIRLDMSEYMEKHEVAKLIGAPPGYVGYEEGGQLTEAVRAKPYSIVLLDEVEKAHPDVFNILLQLLEDGRLTDNKGNTISFKNTIVICTSNIGSALISEKLSKQDTKVERSDNQYEKDYAELTAMINNELRKFFRPELLNRFDDIVIFKPLQREVMNSIAKLGVEKTAKLLKDQGYSIQVTDRALSKLAKEGYDPMYGARPLRRLIQNSVENPIALEIISRRFVSGDTILIDYRGDTNAFAFSKGRNAAAESLKPLDQKTGGASISQVDNKTATPGEVAQSVGNSAQDNQAAANIPVAGQVAVGNQTETQPTASLVSPVTNFDPLSVLGGESVDTANPNITGQLVNQAVSANYPSSVSDNMTPVYQPPPPTTGATIGGAEGAVNNSNYVMGAANEIQDQSVLQGGQLSGSGLNTINEEY